MINFDSILKATTQWGVDHGIKILIILIIAWILIRIFKAIIKKALKSLVQRTYNKASENAQEKRANTLEGVFLSTAKIVVWTVAGLMIISEFNINIGPVLAAVGAAGLALGFGAQYLIRDLISGLFIILEDQYRKGDVIKLGDKAGVVEDLNLRKTILRDLNGSEHHIPNGEIKTTSNLTKEWARIHFDVGVSYDTDLDKAIEVLNKVGKELAEDESWKDLITEAPQVLGVNEFSESSITIKILGQTKPGEQWGAMREMKKRIKKEFDKQEIEIPFPHRVIIRK